MTFYTCKKCIYYLESSEDIVENQENFNFFINYELSSVGGLKHHTKIMKNVTQLAKTCSSQYIESYLADKIHRHIKKTHTQKASM